MHACTLSHTKKMAAAKNTSKPTKPFLCGVVEGFYGRPWTTDQRLDLFTCMSQWSLNCYLYAPKDDDKHRASWRELYLLEEADHLAMLIKETKGRGIEFVYAISPGLDITFSDDKDIQALRRKLEQVMALGCGSFAVLFDDIDPELSLKDSKIFSSAAHAQVTITNDLHTCLGEPEIFLFCPTEYCGNRAVPSVSDSPYLRYIGEHLKPSIDVMWTGPKVISKSISLTSIIELSNVLNRNPVIWDNLHANDYDQCQLYLGPYQGRSTLLYGHLNGVLTNPNCEYGANFIPIHTLAQWKKLGQSYLQRRLENEEEGMDVPLSDVSVYNPTEALQIALRDWMDEFLSSKRKLEDYTPSKDMKSISRATAMEHFNTPDKVGGVMSSLDSEEGGKDRSSSGGSSDMDTTPENINDSLDDSVVDMKGGGANNNNDGQFSIQDLEILVDFYYLPHIHGEKGCFLLDEFTWLKQHVVYPSDDENEDRETGSEVGNETGSEVGNETGSNEGKKSVKVKQQSSDGEQEEEKEEGKSHEEIVEVWLERALQFHNFCEDVNLCFDHLTAIPNRALLYDLYQYMSAAREATMLLDSYITWLEAGGNQTHPKHRPHAKMGGIVAEMMRILPDERERPKTYLIRPYRDEDKKLLYRVCLETGNHGNDGTYLFPNFPDVLGDRYVGPYLQFCADTCYVLEDIDGVCGYILAALDSLKFYENFKNIWVPQVIRKYPIMTQPRTEEESMLQEIHSPSLFLPDSLYQRYPSHLHIDIMERAQGRGNGTNLIKSLLSVLKEKGSCGVHLELSSRNKKALYFYLKLGFKLLDYSQQMPNTSLLMGKVL